MSLYKDASLVMIPSAYKDGKLYSIRPTDGSGDFTFSRGSNLAATRVDVNGLIEKGRENLLLHGSDISSQSGTWLLNQGATTNQNYAIAPDGSMSASKINPISANYSGVAQTLPITGGLIYSYSVYLRTLSGTKDVNILVLDGATNFYNKVVTIDTNWQRFTNTFVPTNGGGGGVYITSYLDTQEFLAWGAQFELGTIATDYIETGASTAQAGILEDMPRLDYSGGASCPALLLEPQRSNSFTNSEYIEGSSWSQDVANFTRVSNQGISPEGLNNATKITPTIAGSPYWYQNNSVTSGTLYTNAIFAKADGFNVLQITGSTGMPSGKHNFDLSSGTHSGDYSSAFMDDLGNGWYRCGVSEAASSTTSGARYLFAIVPNVESARLESVTPNGTDGILVYGATFEQGSYPTSYIPTYGSSVTRTHDVCKITGANATDIINNPSMTLFAEWTTDTSNPSTKVMGILRDNDGSFYNNFIAFTERGDLRASIEVRAGGSTQGVITGDPLTNGNHKAAVVIAENNIRLFVDGSLIDTRTTAIVPDDLDEIYLAGYPDSNLRFGTKKQFVYFPTALTDSECIALTTI